MSTKRSHPRLLGRRAELPASPDKAALDRVPNPHPDTHYAARFTAPEFTTLCPVTGQPDFAHLVIDYVPDRWLVESKSLKLYLGSFRNHGAFHEDCTAGMPIDVFWQTGALPEGVWLPDQGVAPYRGRG
jgi:7-cyano-7-deazaguanine reductase